MLRLNGFVASMVIFGACGCPRPPTGPICGDGVCEPGETAACSDCAAAICGNGVCEGNENAMTCAADCGAGPVCGNSICETGEDATSCPGDCGGGAVCGNGVCEIGEGPAICPADCGGGPVCGNGICEAGETAATCSGDCMAGPVCGNGTCEGGETCMTCAGDCGMCPASCGDGVCNAGETPSNCPPDCPCSAHAQCGLDEICFGSACTYAWGRSYWFTAYVETNGNDPACGCAWDSLGGAPDPFACLLINGIVQGCTFAEADTFDTWWGTSGWTILLQDDGALITFEVWDEDAGGAHDYIIGMMGTPDVWLNVLRMEASPPGGYSSVTSAAGYFEVTIDPL